MVLAVGLSWFVAQVVKQVWVFLKLGRADVAAFLLPGGMPSVHAALVAAITTAIYFAEGVGSIFGLALVVSFIIVYDAMTLRKQVEIHSAALQRLGIKGLSQRVGHTPLQVFVGIIIGVVVTVIVYV